MTPRVTTERVDGKIRTTVFFGDRPPLIYSLPAPEAVSVGRQLVSMGLEEIEAQEDEPS